MAKAGYPPLDDHQALRGPEEESHRRAPPEYVAEPDVKPHLGRTPRVAAQRDPGPRPGGSGGRGDGAAGPGPVPAGAVVDAPAGYRNGYGKPRKLTTPLGPLTLRRPRVRGLEERFESRIRPLFARRTKEVSERLPKLDLHGLAEGNFDLALRGLLGEGAPLSGRTVARLKERWEAEWRAWRARRLDELQAVCLWMDGRGLRCARQGAANGSAHLLTKAITLGLLPSGRLG